MLQEKAMIVNLSISQWTARKHDKKITREVDESHNAKDAGRYNKVLMAKEKLKDIQQSGNAARTWYYENTLPWGDNGDRILPSANYFDFIQKMNQFKTEFENFVIEFGSNYDYFVSDEMQRLNGLYNAADYPNRLEIESRFSFRITFFPLPEADFRIDIAQSEIEVLKKSMETEMNSRLNNAVADTWTRIKDQLTHMKTKLSDKDAIFRNSLFDNLKDIIVLLPRLNITNDVHITRISNEMKALLVDPEAVRTNDNLRAQKAEQVEQLMSKFQDFF